MTTRGIAEMSELTRKQIEQAVEEATLALDPTWHDRIKTLGDMALRTLGAEDREEAAQENWSHEVERLGERAEQAEARIREMEAALQQERDIRSDREIHLQLIAEKIGLETEPHQTYWERMLEAVDRLRSRNKQLEVKLSGSEPPKLMRVLERKPDGMLIHRQVELCNVCSGGFEIVLSAEPEQGEPARGSGVIDGYPEDDPPPPGCAEPCPTCDGEGAVSYEGPNGEHKWSACPDCSEPAPTPDGGNDALPKHLEWALDQVSQGMWVEPDDGTGPMATLRRALADYGRLITTPDGGEGALEAFERIASGGFSYWIRNDDTIPSASHDALLCYLKSALRRAFDEDAVHRALREPRVPESIFAHRPAIRSSCQMLRERFEEAKCDSPATAVCVRCNVMFLVNELDRALAQSEQGRVPEGCKLVPAEPTGRMTEAGSAEVEGPFDSFAGDAMANRIYAAMLVSAPQQEQMPDVETIRDAIVLLEQSAGPFDEACRILRAADPEQSEQRSVPDE